MLNHDPVPNGESVPELIESEILSLLLDSDDDEEISIAPDSSLHELGLNSLMLAQLLVILEAEFGVDPFGADLSIADMRTVQDLVSAYERALQAAEVA
jgi:acyl carrier protein